MATGRDWPTIQLVAALCALAAVLSGPVMTAASAESQFWQYVDARDPGASTTISRHDVTNLSEGLCSDPPVSNIEVRNSREYDRTLAEAGAKRSPRDRATVAALTAVTDAIFTVVCPPTKQLPAHPRRDLMAGFPLPKGSILDDDPVLGRPDDDRDAIDARDTTYRTASYLVPDHLTRPELERFYLTRVQAGAPWRGWSWCTSTGTGFDGSGGTYTWQRGAQRLSLSWYAVRDDLVHAPGTLLVDVSSGRETPTWKTADCD